MKFIIVPQHGITQDSTVVWDPENNRELCTFVHGEFETEDKAVIDKLIQLGYEIEAPEPNAEDDETNAEDDEKSLRAKAKELGIKSYHLKSIETLTAEIAEIGGE